MPTITVRNVPEAVVLALKDLAKRNRRSMEQEVRRLLESVVEDRLSACRQIEESWERQEFPTTRDQVDTWLAGSRP